MHGSRRGEPVEKLPTKHSSSLQAQQCSLMSNTNGPTTTGRIYPRTKKNLGHWNNSYKKAHAKARTKAQAAEGSDKFGSANADEWVIKKIEVTTDNSGDKVGMKALEGYFDNLATAATNNKAVLEQLVAKNAKLAVTNEELVAIVKKMFNKIKDIQQETYPLKKTGGSGATQGKRDPTLFPHSKKEVYHSPDDCFELAKNKDKRLPGSKSWLGRCGTVSKSELSKSEIDKKFTHTARFILTLDISNLSLPTSARFKSTIHTNIIHSEQTPQAL